MRKHTFGLLAALAVMAAVLPAQAADLGVAPIYKAPFLPGSTGGWYIDVGASAGVANGSTSGTNLFATSLVSGNLVADGGSVDVGAGYIRNGGPLNTWWQFRVGASYQNISGGTLSGSISSRWRVTEEADVGADIFQQALSAIGNVGGVSNVFSSLNGFVPALPSNVSVGASPRQYVGFVLEEAQLQGSFGAAQGQTWYVAPGVKTGWLWQTLGKDGKPNGNALEVWASAAWPTQGASFNNVFATNGTPLTIGPSVKEGTTYRAGIDYKFGL